MTARKAFSLATGADTAGVSVRLAQAFKSNPDWCVRSMVATSNYIKYPQDLPYSVPSLQHQYDEADLVILNSTMHGHRWYDRGQGKPTIIMHHGFHYGHFDRNIHECVADAADFGATQVGSTVNLELLAPLGPPGSDTVTWLPTAYDMDWLRLMRDTYYKPHEGLIRIAHAPTDRAIKSTKAVISAVEQLKTRGFPVELVLIERQTWSQTMILKGNCDILVDQLNLGYGCNAIEAWGLGIPVIGAVNEHPDWRRHMIDRFGLIESPTRLPFYETDEDGLQQALLDMVSSQALREDWGAIGWTHAMRHHSNESVTKLATSLFESASLLPTKPSSAPLTQLKGDTQAQRLNELRRIRAEQRLQAVQLQQSRHLPTAKDQ